MRLAEGNLNLSPRLKMIADMVPEGGKVADIGTDHGYVPIYLVQKGICPGAIASDVRIGPLERAKSNIEKYGMQDRIALSIFNGIDDEKMAGCSTIIIAGMGGELIREIVKNSTLTKKEEIILILQPMTGDEELREFLYSAGYSILEEHLCQEEDKLYLAMKVIPRKAKVVPEVFWYVGKELLEKEDPLLGSYIDKKIAAKQKEKQGLERSRDPKKEYKIQKLEQLIAQLQSLRTKGVDGYGQC